MMSSDSYISVPVLGSTRYGACILPPRLTSSARRGLLEVVEVELAEHLADLAAVGTPFEVVELEELRRIRTARGGHAREGATPEADGGRGEGGDVIDEAHGRIVERTGGRCQGMNPASCAARGPVDCGQAMSHRSDFRQAPGRATQARVGHIVVRVRLSARRSATADFLVDTGATHSIVPPALARKVGAPTLPQRFEVLLADGRRRRLKACSMS